MIYKNNKTNNNFKANLSDFQSSVVCKLSTTFTVTFLTLCVCIYHLECVIFIPVRSHWCQRHAQYIQWAILDCLLVQESNSLLSVLVYFKVTFFGFFLFYFIFLLLDKPGHVFDLIYVPASAFGQELCRYKWLRWVSGLNLWDTMHREFEVELLLLHFKRSQLEHLIRSLLGVSALRFLGLKH